MARVAVVGGGQIASKVYLPALVDMPDVELAVLVEPNQERRDYLSRQYRFDHVLSSLAEMRPGQADCAFLLTPEHVRREPLTALLGLGLDVLCEKPLSLTLPEAEELAACAERSEQIVMVGFNRRFMPVYHQAREFIAGRKVELCCLQKERANLVAHSIHVLDVLRWLCGEVVEVQAAGNFAGDRETLAAALIRFDTGALGVFQSSAGFGVRKEMTEISGEGYTVIVEAPSRALLYEHEEERVEYVPDGTTWYLPAHERYGFSAEIRHFLEAVSSRRVPENSASEAIKTHRLAFQILAEMRKHGAQP